MAKPQQTANAPDLSNIEQVAKVMQVPGSLMGQPATTKLSEFNEKVNYHANMESATNALLSLLQSNMRELLVFLIGPSGVGKTALCLFILKSLLEEYAEELKIDKEWLPYIYSELEDTSERYSWGEFYRTGLHAAKEPLIDFKILPRNPVKGLYDFTGKATIDRWGYAYADALRHRRTRAVFIDNANMLDLIPTHKKEWVTNPLIGLRKITPHYLFGTYALLRLRNLNGQIARRARIIHYPRYHATDSHDEKAFQNVLIGFENYLPTENRVDLLSYQDFLHEGCIGCIGILKDWLSFALEAAFIEGAKTITPDHLCCTRLDDDSLRRLELEAAAGETMFLSDPQLRETAQDQLYKVEEKWVERYGKVVQSATPSKRSEPAARRGRGCRGRRRPGEPNPKKIKIGQDQRETRHQSIDAPHAKEH